MKREETPSIFSFFLSLSLNSSFPTTRLLLREEDLLSLDSICKSKGKKKKKRELHVFQPIFQRLVQQRNWLEFTAHFEHKKREGKRRGEESEKQGKKRKKQWRRMNRKGLGIGSLSSHFLSKTESSMAIIRDSNQDTFSWILYLCFQLTRDRGEDRREEGSPEGIEW